MNTKDLISIAVIALLTAPVLAQDVEPVLPTVMPNSSARLVDLPVCKEENTAENLKSFDEYLFVHPPAETYAWSHVELIDHGNTIDFVAFKKSNGKRFKPIDTYTKVSDTVAERTGSDCRRKKGCTYIAPSGVEYPDTACYGATFRLTQYDGGDRLVVSHPISDIEGCRVYATGKWEIWQELVRRKDSNDIVGSWTGCDGRVIQFERSSGEFVGRYIALGRLTEYGFSANEIGYRAQETTSGTYEGQVKWRWTTGEEEWRTNTITISGDSYSDTNSDSCTKSMQRVPQ